LELLSQVNLKLNGIGNPIHESVPISNNEDDNRIERKWGEPIDLGGPVDAKTPGRYHHDQVLQRIGGFESERGRKVAAHRAYYLTGPGVMLNSALV
jgi:seryl-tRNA synthetase